MKPETKKEALHVGMKVFYPNTMCPHGHVEARYVCNGACVKCLNDRAKAKAKANPQRHRENGRRHWARNKEAELARSKAWRDANPIRIKQLEKQRNQAKVSAKNIKRLRGVSNATPKWLNKDQWEQMNSFYTHAKDCHLVSGEKYDVDHIVPIQGKNVCGLHVPWNLQVLPADLNRKKSNR